MLPVLLRLGPVEVPTYGVLVAAAWLAATQWALSRRAVTGLSEDEAWSVAYWVFGGAFAGGKLLYLVVGDADWSDPLSVLRYGFVFYGGLLGALAGGAWLCRRRGWSFLALADHFIVALPLGHAIGRLGCLAAGCCYGSPTSLPWGVSLAGAVRHPVQAYEAGLNLGLFAFLAFVAAPRARAERRRPGSVLALYAAVYALIRFAVEFLRDDPRGAWGPLSPSQWIALGTAAAALAWRARGGRPA